MASSVEDLTVPVLSHPKHTNPSQCCLPKGNPMSFCGGGGRGGERSVLLVIFMLLSLSVNIGIFYINKDTFFLLFSRVI